MDDSQNVMILQDDREFWWVCVDISVLRDKRLSVYAKAAYAILCTYASTQGRECFPSIKLIAESASMSERTAQRALAQLADCGYIRRQARYRDGAQISTLYKIVGHKAVKGGDCGTPPPRQTVTGAVSVCHPELKPEEPDKSKDTPTVEPQAPEDGPLMPNQVPAVMRETVELFYAKTGRKTLMRSELAPLLVLAKTHYPARVQKEITVAVDRFKRLGRPPDTLTIDYICTSLGSQRSYKPAGQCRQTGKTTKENSRAFDDLEAANEAALVAQYGGGKDDG